MGQMEWKRKTNKILKKREILFSRVDRNLGDRPTFTTRALIPRPRLETGADTRDRNVSLT
jgi:hypothetical protein